MVAAAMKQDESASIGRTTRIVGRLTGDGDLLVEGRIEGEVSLRGNLSVTEGGVIVAPVEAGDVTVSGSVDGDVTARGAVTLRAGGTVRGAITASRIAVEDGARFTGRIEMDVELPPGLGGTPATSPEGRRAGKRG
jgi:cytoskeletal protein CcmA (bactofilin family)